MLQIAAEELGVPIDMVHTNETTTDAIGNAQATSASFSADLNGPAVMEACQKLRKRLDLIKGKCSQKSFSSLSCNPFITDVSVNKAKICTVTCHGRL